MDALTAEDVAFLARPLHGFFTAAAGPQPPQPRPVWFELAVDRTLQFFTAPDSLKVRRLRRDPRASLVVAAPADEHERWVSVAGHTRIGADGAHELASRLAARYWDLDDPVRADELAAILATDQVRVVLHAETVRRFAF
ncbi:pyridoxamine 5'-phosphate oxidase family protein [Pseudonocardia sp.]|uniref:pyridoxamine 5'-phosphate oxidase family protein n=1 Tax=Pseudonocardia sp. TaxID=60912 RepID=UPI003D117AD1